MSYYAHTPAKVPEIVCAAVKLGGSPLRFSSRPTWEMANTVASLQGTRLQDGGGLSVAATNDGGIEIAVGPDEPSSRHAPDWIRQRLSDA